MIKSYTMKRKDRASIDVGASDVCYDFMGCDYGCSNDDSRDSGIEHTAVTLKSDGGNPFFTIPKDDLELRP